MTGIARKAQPLNRVFWYYEQILRGTGKNANSCEWLVLGKRPDLRLLAGAARLVAQKHPVLRARWRAGRFLPPRWTCDAAAPEIAVSTFTTPAPDNPVDVHSPLVWGRPLDLASGPPWRLHVIQHTDVTFLQIITTHIFTDGKSANQLVGDFVAAYDHMACDQPFDNTPVEPCTRDFANLYLGNLRGNELRAAYGRAIRSILSDIFSPCVNLPVNSPRTGRTRIVLLDFGSALLETLRSKSRSEGISRHPFYVAAMTEAVAGFNANHGGRTSGILKFVDNFSIRGFASEDVANLYDLCAVPYDLRIPMTDRTDTEFRRHVACNIEDRKSGGILDEVVRQIIYTKSAFLTPKLLATRLLLGVVVKSNIFLSNVGPIPHRVFDASALDVRDYYSFSQLFPPGKLMIFLSTTDVSLRLVCLWDDAAFNEADVIEDFLPRFRSVLERSDSNRVEAGKPCGDVA